jgi:hypothetical protein
MDWQTFVTKIVESLAWPAATVTLVCILRDDIRKLLPFLKKLKAGPVEAEFEREVKELRNATRGPEQIVAADSTYDTASKQFLVQLAEMHPRSAILESWVRVEAAARAALSKREASIAVTTYVPAARLAEPLIQQQIINQSQVTLFHELRRLRNEVAHSPDFEPTTDAAIAYVDLATSLQAHLASR